VRIHEKPGGNEVVQSKSHAASGFESWGNATFAIFDIVNRQLEGLPYRFYAFDNGNGLYGMFMTKEIYAEFVGSMKRKIEWPYIPEPEPPWYGQAHD
jgi:hypothetical protein